MVKLQVGREVYEDSVLFDLSSVFYFSGLELSIECELRYREIMEEVCYTSLRRVGGEVFGVCGDEGGFHIIKEKADKGCVYEIEWDSIVEEKIQYRSHDEKVLLSMKSWFYMLVFKLHERGVLAGR